MPSDRGRASALSSSDPPDIGDERPAPGRIQCAVAVGSLEVRDHCGRWAARAGLQVVEGTVWSELAEDELVSVYVHRRPARRIVFSGRMSPRQPVGHGVCRMSPHASGGKTPPWSVWMPRSPWHSGDADARIRAESRLPGPRILLSPQSWDLDTRRSAQRRAAASAGPRPRSCCGPPLPAVGEYVRHCGRRVLELVRHRDPAVSRGASSGCGCTNSAGTAARRDVLSALAGPHRGRRRSRCARCDGCRRCCAWLRIVTRCPRRRGTEPRRCRSSGDAQPVTSSATTSRSGVRPATASWRRSRLGAISAASAAQTPTTLPPGGPTAWIISDFFATFQWR